MKVEKISRKFIKPYTPTPQSLKNYNISLIDKFKGPFHFAVILFYESKPENNTHLQESLAKTLVQFYPLAGRYVSTDQMVDCSDQGVEFIEAEALDVELLDFIANIKAEHLGSLLSDQYFRFDETAANPIMSIQATRFASGGLAIGINVSHRIVDASSLERFVATWSKATNLYNNKIFDSLTPLSFDLPLLIPIGDCEIQSGFPRSIMMGDPTIVAKRLLFNSKVLSSLKSKIGQNCAISRVRIVSAMIAKTLIDLDRMKLGTSRDFVVTHVINMRGRTIIPQPKYLFGNFSIISVTPRMASSGIGLKELVDVIGESIKKNMAEFAEMLSPNCDGSDIFLSNHQQSGKIIMDVDVNKIMFTDWSKFGFNEANFGWGKPVWVGFGPNQRFNQMIVLMRNKEGDGIEAWVHLNQDDMHYFEQIEEIKLYTIN